MWQRGVLATGAFTAIALCNDGVFPSAPLMSSDLPILSGLSNVQNPTGLTTSGSASTRNERELAAYIPIAKSEDVSTNAKRGKPEANGKPEEIIKRYIAYMEVLFPHRNNVVWRNEGKNNPRWTYYTSPDARDPTGTSTGFSQLGYEVQTFEWGEFHMDGFRGFDHWGFSGNFTRDPIDGPDLEFGPRDPTTTYISDRLELNERRRRDPDRASISSLPAWNVTVQQKAGIFQPAPPPASLLTSPGLEHALPKRSWDLALFSRSRSQGTPHDGTYFVYCNGTGGERTNSGVAYYRDMEPGRDNGRLPDDLVWVERDHGPFFGKSIGAAEFLDGEAAVQWSIFGGGMDPTTEKGLMAGLANDGKEYFEIYRDDEGELFATEEYRCFSQYYAS